MFRQVLEAALDARGLKTREALKTAGAAERMRRLRDRKRNKALQLRNAKRNAPQRGKRNALRNADVTDGVTVSVEAVIMVPLNDGSDFAVTEPMVIEFERLYPAVDVPQTMREIRGWNLARPTQRKTRGGILKHINGWLAREQNKG